jgi:biopolymer transport protein ExbB
MRTIRINARTILTAAALALVAPLTALAADTDPSFQETAATAQQDLQRSLEELTALRQAIADEKLPLTRRLREVENQLTAIRGEHEDLSRTLDLRSLELNNMRPEIEGREQENAYLANLFDEYARNFETRVHISELQRYREVIDRARLAPDDPDLSPEDVYAAQLDLVATSLDRLNELVGGTTFAGSAVDSEGNGVVKDVRFALIGPVALYSAADGSSAGLAEQRLGSLEPNMIALPEPAQAAEVRAIVASGAGRVPFDPSLGNALKIEATRDSLVEHIKKGGVVMVPILMLAAAALIVALLKWFQIVRVPNPSRSKLEPVLEAVKQNDQKRAARQAGTLRGPIGEMLQAGTQHLTEPKELVEEVMFEKMLETRLRLQNWLPFVAMAASAAPLLGLLGTVTGMINTFKLITVFGSGDAKTLSGGISEALITTQFGLIVAIPSLLLYAYLSRRARRLVDGMEKTAVSFLNRMPGTTQLRHLAGPSGGSGEGEQSRSNEEVKGGAVPLTTPEPAMARPGAHVAPPSISQLNRIDS